MRNENRSGVPSPSPRLTSTELSLISVAPRHARLAVELRIMGAHAVLWMLIMGICATWLSSILSPDQLVLVPWGILIAPALGGFYVAAVALWSRLPTVRWVRTTALRSPSPTPLMIAGALGAPLFAALIARDRRARRRLWSEQEVEWGFRELVRVPRRTAVTFATSASVAIVFDTAIVALQAPIDATDAVVYAVGCMLLIGAGGVIAYSRTQAMLRPELLSAPREGPTKNSSEGDIRVRLIAPSIVVLVAGCLLPGTAGYLAARAEARARAVEHAGHVAEQLLDAATTDPQRLAAAVAGREGTSVWRGDRRFGVERALRPALAGTIDDDGDGSHDALARTSGATTVLVPLERQPVPVAPWILPGFLAFLVLAAVAWRVVGAAREDVLRARRQVGFVARGEIPPPLRADSFHTRDLRLLVQAVDRLVSRIAESNIAKYVVIEKAKEADRLKSQFLANMSHDLRSPLNSVIGFSDLLMQGIDGELTPGQREMIEIVSERGVYLLRQIDDILDAAKLDAGRMEITPERLSVRQLVAEAVTMARPRLATTTEVTTATQTGTPDALADPHRAVQAIAQVVEFASDGINNDRVMVNARDERRPDGRAIVIDVLTPRQFEGASEIELARRGFARMPGREGLGLALPIAGSILELHGGALDIQEASGHTRFSIRLPIAEGSLR